MLQTLDQWLRYIFLQNFQMKAVALLLTLALYLWVSVDREVERVRYVPVRYSVPEQWVLVNHPPEKAGVTIRGKWSDLSRVDASQLDMIRVQITPEMGSRGNLTLSPDLIELPPGLRAVEVQPSTVQFRLEERRTKIVRIQPKIVGEPPDGYRIDEVSASPDKVTVSGPEQSLDELTMVSTEPIIADGQTQPFTTTAYLRLDDPLLEYNLQKPVKISVSVVTRQIEREISQLPVEALNATQVDIKSVTPAQVSVHLRGPKAVMDSLDPGQLLASVDLDGEAPNGPKTVERQVQIRNIPDSVELLSTQPRFFRIFLTPQQEKIAGE